MATRLLSEHLAQLTTAYGISFDDLAHALSTDRKTVYRWVAGETFPQSASRARLDQLDSLLARLDATFVSRDAAREWLHAESGYFGGLRPIDALLSGRPDAVTLALEALDAGIFV